jgi:hypothetical protein
MALRRQGGPAARLARAAISLALGGSWLAGALPASATTLVYEPFAYDADTILDGTPATGQNLTGSYAALGTAPQQKLVAESPGLDYGSLTGAPAASGGRISDAAGVTAAGATVSVDQDVVVDPGDAIFWSALFTFDDSMNGNHLANITFRDDDTGDLLIFGEPGVGVRAIRVEAMTAGTGGLVASGADGAFADGDTLLLIGRYFNGASPNGDTLELIGYDTADADTLPGSFDPADPNAEFSFALSDLDIDFAKIGSISFTIRGNDNNYIDELRIGSSYSSVVPEPATAGLLLLGLVGLGFASRTRPPQALGRSSKAG